MFFVNLHKRLYWDEGEKNQASLCCKLNFDRIVRTEQKQHNQNTKISIKINKYSKNKYSSKVQVSKSPLLEAHVTASSRAPPTVLKHNFFQVIDLQTINHHWCKYIFMQQHECNLIIPLEKCNFHFFSMNYKCGRYLFTS